MFTVAHPFGHNFGHVIDHPRRGSEWLGRWRGDAGRALVAALRREVDAC